MTENQNQTQATENNVASTPFVHEKPVSTATTSSTVSSEAFSKFKLMLKGVESVLDGIEMDLRRAKIMLSKLSNFDPSQTDVESLVNEGKKTLGTDGLKKYKDDENVQVVEGLFDGYFMIGPDQKKYPVPLNYASKTKLIPGDKLKLKIMEDGTLIYKLIVPAERRHIRAVLSQEDDNKFVALTDEGKSYFLNQAAVTFFKGRPGDEVYIIVNKDGTGSFAAIEAIIKK